MPTEPAKRESQRWPGDGRPMFATEQLWMDAAPVSCAEYQVFLDASGRRAPAGWQGARPPPERLHLPVVAVSLEDARAYARWANKRLPLNHEWTSGMAWVGFDVLCGGQVWEWTASRSRTGYVVRGGRFRDQTHFAALATNASWDDGPADDIGFRCVADRHFVADR